MNEAQRKLAEHAMNCPHCGGPDDGCEEGQRLEEAILREVPPAEPDSGIQEQKELHCERCNKPYLECACLGGPLITLGKPHAPADHVEHVLQKELSESFRLAESEHAAEKLGGNIVKQEYWKGELAVLHRLRRLLSEHCSGSPVTSVSAKPDLAPWAVEENTNWIGSYLVDGNGKRIAYSQFKANNLAIRDAHNASLPAPRSGSEVSGEAMQTFLQGLSDDERVPMAIRADIDQFLFELHLSPAPSAPSSAELEEIARTLAIKFAGADVSGN